MLIMDFGAFVCPKCTNRPEKGGEIEISYVEHDSSREEGHGPKIEHLNVECKRCKFEWYMRCSDIDIEQEFGDLDFFSAICPKCKDPQVDMTFCSEEKPAARRYKNVCDMMEGADKKTEHLHCSCEVCGYAWNSVTADWKAPEKAAESKEAQDIVQAT